MDRSGSKLRQFIVVYIYVSIYTTHIQKTAIMYETEIILSMECSYNNNVLADLTDDIVTSLDDLTSEQYTNSNIDSIAIEITEDGQCKYIITTKVVTKNEPDAYRLQAYANNNELSTDFANKLEAQVPGIDDIFILRWHSCKNRTNNCVNRQDIM